MRHLFNTKLKIIIILAVLLVFLNVEKDIEQKQAEIKERRGR